MARGWALRILACLAAVTVLVTGCSHKQEPKAAAPTTSAKPSPTLPPLGPADFPVPAEGRQKTEAGVIAFAKYYIDLTNHLAATLDSGPLRELSKGCEECDRLVASFDADRAAGYRYEGGHVAVTSTGSASVDGDRGEMSFLLEKAALTVRDSSGAVVQAKSSGPYQLSGGMELTWDHERSTWLATQLAVSRI